MGSNNGNENNAAENCSNDDRNPRTRSYNLNCGSQNAINNNWNINKKNNFKKGEEGTNGRHGHQVMHKRHRNGLNIIQAITKNT